MATNPRVLILDSPTVGVDIGAKDGIYEIIRRLAREGVAVLMISDEIPEVLYHSHRVLVMREGRLTTDVVAADILRRCASAGGQCLNRGLLHSADFGAATSSGCLIVILALCAGLGVANDQFLTLQNLFDLLTSYAFVGILALGLLVVLIAGDIDISFTATASVAQYVTLTVANPPMARLDQRLCHRGRRLAVRLAPSTRSSSQKLRIPSIIVSVATLNIFYGLLIFFTGGKYIYSLPDWFATGIFWFEFEWGKGTSYGVNLQILALAFSLSRHLAAAQPHQYRPADLRAWEVMPMPRSGSASMFSASTCWSIATWGSWPASPRSSRRNLRSR